jgi:1-pyrroline-5-carboxylate dehydrogenase
LEQVNTTAPYALTGAVFARERGAIMTAMDHLRDAAGNFYVRVLWLWRGRLFVFYRAHNGLPSPNQINTKSTGAVVGQQPFGGARASGTNDKAGAGAYLMRFVSAQSVKENLHPISGWKYPHME